MDETTNAPPAHERWLEANQRSLMAELDRVRQAVEAAADGHMVERAPHAASMSDGATPTLAMLRATFELSPFERDVLLLCAGIELDSGFEAACARAHGDGRAYPTFGLALATLPDPHWSALTPAGPLRHWRLIEVDAHTGSALVDRRLRIDERILHFLTGVQHLDERLIGLVTSVRGDTPLAPSHQQLAQHIATLWTRIGAARAPVAHLCGPAKADRRAVAAGACARMEIRLCAIAASDLPHAPAEQGALIRLWEREAALTGSALLLEIEDDAAPSEGSAGEAMARARRFVERVNAPLLISSRDRLRDAARPLVAFDVGKPTGEEQRELWRATLGNEAASLNGKVDALVSQFNLSAGAIRNVGLVIGDGAPANGGSSSRAHPLGMADLWDACRVQARPRLDDLAQRIEPSATWDDLVLPDAHARVLREIAAQLRQRTKVYESWGFARRGARGLGISALFAGASGTGKTMAAEVLANELRLDLYRIDLSQVVSKYIGETEKNLRRVFDAAEDGGAILLFDEADALFGKRSEVKDSHDRYANIEVSYLLQKMEAYRGLAILTTNMKSALDQAFLRRIRFVVQFPFPDVAQRAEIWRRAFPAATPLAGLHVEKLARLNVAGGSIRNIALNAAFLAADADEPVRMQHLLQAAHSEYAKLEKPLSEAEVGNW